MTENFESRKLSTLDEFRNEMKLLTRDLVLSGFGPSFEELERQGFVLKITGAFTSGHHDETYYLMRKGSSKALIHDVFVEKEDGTHISHHFGDTHLIKEWGKKYEYKT